MIDHFLYALLDTTRIPVAVATVEDDTLSSSSATMNIDIGSSSPMP